MTKNTIEQNWLDKLYTFVAPVKAAERYKARVTLAMASSYSGASRTRRSLSEFIPSSGDADSDLIYDLPLLRQRSRDLLRNNPLALGAVNTVCTSVIGTGLTLQSRIDRDFLGLSDKEADSWEANTEREFRLWAESTDCDAGRHLTFAQLQSLVFRSTLENGDCFVLLSFIDRPTSPYALALQIIEADRVCNSNHQSDSDTLVAGVQKDKYGAPVSYHILKTHPGNRSSQPRQWQIIPAFSRCGTRRQILHVYKVVRPGQTRGVPYLAPVIEALKQLGSYTDAEIMAAVVSSYFTVFVKTPTGDADLAPMSLSNSKAATNDNYALGNGAIIGLAEGEDITTANPGRPNAQFDPFIQAILRQIGVALELPFELLIKHFTASYSAARAALLEAWRFFMTQRTWLAQQFCQKVYEAWLLEAVLLGRIQAPGFVSGDTAIRAAFLGSQWTGTAPGQIDPLKEIQAARERISLGVSTLSRETAMLTGEDWEKTHKQTVKEQRMRQHDNIPTEDDTKNSSIKPSFQPEENTNDEELSDVND